MTNDDSTLSSIKMNHPYPDKILQNSYIAVKRCKHGYLMYNTNDMYIGRSLDVYGEWCENELNLLSNYIKRGDTIVDVGANIGTHSLFFANSVGETGTVYALEPQRIQQQILCANLVMNGIQNVYTDQLVASDKFEQALIPVLNPEIDHNFGAVYWKYRESPTSSIKVLRVTWLFPPPYLKQKPYIPIHASAKNDRFSPNIFQKAYDENLSISNTIEVKDFGSLNGKYNLLVYNPKYQNTLFDSSPETDSKSQFDLYSLFDLDS